MAMMQVGTFSEYVVASERSLVKINDWIPLEAASLVSLIRPVGEFIAPLSDPGALAEAYRACLDMEEVCEPGYAMDVVGTPEDDEIVRLDCTCSCASACEDALLAYSWPGNIRQLQNTVRRAVVLNDAEKSLVEIFSRMDLYFRASAMLRRAPCR